ncbi:NAD-dependent epimerase/dehydratase family protein [Janibacter sp. GS2]|uniref:NAD-dependent epimerase/dehydratase family protein n=1 Tax=Janibacter sp. GS2 TaxID=3442646 RepID=UPI003EB8DB38
MKVLLTGHHGYLGTVMSAVLTSAGHEVTGLDTDYFVDRVIGPEPDSPSSIRCDLREVSREHVEGHDAVVHLAALSNDPLGALAPEITHEINHRASTRLARLAKDAGVPRFLYASTCSVYGASDTTGMLDEEAPLAPVTAYARSKVGVEADLTALADEDFSPTMLRNATAFGFSPRLRCDIVLNNLIGHAVLTGTVTVLSDGTPWRPLVHARDIAAAFLATLESEREAVHAQAFNVGHPANNLTVADIAEVAADAVPGAGITITGEHGADPRSYRVSLDKMADLVPAYVPAWDIPRGAAELAEAYTTHGLTTHGFEVDHIRLAVLQELVDAGRLDGRDLRWTG